MFTGLWKRTAPVEASDDLTHRIVRTYTEPLTFEGELGIQLSGMDAPDYHPGEPYHEFSVYRVESSGYGVVIEFHQPDHPTLVDAELVSGIDEMDDFFCIHASDSLQNPELARGGMAQLSPEVQQQVIQRYDTQVHEVLKQLRCMLAGEAPPVVDLRIPSAASGVDWSAQAIMGIDGSGGAGNE